MAGNTNNIISKLLVLTVICVNLCNCLSFPSVAVVSNKSNSQSNEIEVQRTNAQRRGIFFNVGIPVPDIPDPHYTVSQSLDYWPYKRFYTVQLSTVVKKLYKALSYLFELACISLRIALQAFDIFQMKKSFDQLSHSHGWEAEENYGPGGHDDDWKKLGRLWSKSR